MPVEQLCGVDLSDSPEEEEPMLLLAVNAEESVSWKDIEQRVRLKSCRAATTASWLIWMIHTGEKTGAISRAVDQRSSQEVD